MAGEGRERTLFQEEQRFRQWWIRAAVAGMAVFSWFDFVSRFLVRRPPGNRPAPRRMTVLERLLSGIGLPWLLRITRLAVEVRRDGLHYRFYPFHLHWHRIAREEVVRAEARTYRPLLEYGGWGIRWGWKGGKAYTVSGNRGVQLTLRDGRKVLFGSRRPEELAAALERVISAADA